jgi:hypothetical protein
MKRITVKRQSRRLAESVDARLGCPLRRLALLTALLALAGACAPAAAQAVSFTAPTNFSAHRNPISVAVGDLNGDSKPDLAVANPGSDDVSILLNATNNPPECSSVVAGPALLLPTNHRFRVVTLSGATDPDGDPVTISITGVTQDERVTGPGDHTSPDAVAGDVPNEVRLRAERNPRGDGRVYRIAFEASDGKGGTCDGLVTVEVPRRKGVPAIDSAPPSYDSFAF